MSGPMFVITVSTVSVPSCQAAFDPINSENCELDPPGDSEVRARQ